MGVRAAAGADILPAVASLAALAPAAERARDYSQMRPPKPADSEEGKPVAEIGLLAGRVESPAAWACAVEDGSLIALAVEGFVSRQCSAVRRDLAVLDLHGLGSER